MKRDTVSETNPSPPNTLYLLYKKLYSAYGPQGWWPIINRRNNPGFNGEGYHPGIYVVPTEREDLFYIITGAVLTQNTSWKNVQTVLNTMYERGVSSPEKVLSLSDEELSFLIKSSGYYNQKTKKLKILFEFLLKNTGLQQDKPPKREELLSLWGIGPETADSILLYGYGIKLFVVDAYTRRLLARFWLCATIKNYDIIAEMFTEALKNAPVSCYNEFHALIVEHAKRHCGSLPQCGDCPLEQLCHYALKFKERRCIKSARA